MILGLLVGVSMGLAADEVPVDLEAHLHGYAAARLSAYGSTPLGFAMDDLVLAYDANLDRFISLHAEVAYGLPKLGKLLIEMEVLSIDIKASDRFSFQVGRFRNPMSPWAKKGTRGSYRYLTYSTPEILFNENKGGVLPIHLVGVQASVNEELGFWTVGLDTALSNGRGPLTSIVDQSGDFNWFKSILGHAWVQAPSGFTLGLSALYDKIPTVPQLVLANSEIVELPHLVDPVDELILSAEIHWDGPKVAMMGEEYWISHSSSQGQVVSTGGYFQVSYKVNAFQPYLRSEHLNSDAADLLVQSFEADGRSEVKGSAGLRYDFATHAAIKVQLDLISDTTQVLGQPAQPSELQGGAHVELSAGF